MADDLTNLERLIDKKMAPLMEMQQQLIDQNIKLSAQLSSALSAAPTPPPTPSGASYTRSFTPKSRGIVIDRMGDGRLSIMGNTFDIKDTIKELGGSWDKPHKSWVIDRQDNTPADIKAALEEAGCEQITISCAM